MWGGLGRLPSTMTFSRKDQLTAYKCQTWPGRDPLRVETQGRVLEQMGGGVPDSPKTKA